MKQIDIQEETRIKLANKLIELTNEYSKKDFIDCIYYTLNEINDQLTIKLYLITNTYENYEKLDEQIYFNTSKTIVDNFNIILISSDPNYYDNLNNLSKQKQPDAKKSKAIYSLLNSTILFDRNNKYSVIKENKNIVIPKNILDILEQTSIKTNQPITSINTQKR